MSVRNVGEAGPETFSSVASAVARYCFLTIERRKRRGLEEAKNKLGVGAVDGVKVAKVREKLGCQLIR